METIDFGGLQYDKFSSAAGGTPVQEFWVCLHGRKGSRGDTHKLARLLVERRVPTTAICVDLRNHGARLLDATQNEGVENPTHPADMYSQILGSSCDVGFLLDVLPEANARGVRVGLIGVSMGGHTALIHAAANRRVNVCISLIGSPDYRTLLNLRYEGKCPFTDNMNRLIDKHDTINADADQFQGKRVLLCFGADDELVPISTSVAFQAKVPQITVKSYPGVAHRLCRPMIEDAIKFSYPSTSSQL